MASKVVHPVRIEEPLEPFLQEAGDIAYEFLNLRLLPTEAAAGTKAPHPAAKDAKGEPGLLRAADEFPESAEPTASELPDSLPLIGDGGRRQDLSAASGPPPPPTQPSSRVIAERLKTIGDSIEKDINDELKGELHKLLMLGTITAFSVRMEPFVDVCRRVMGKFSQKFQTGWQQITFVFDAMTVLVEMVRDAAGGNSTQTTEQQIRNFIGQALAELGLYRWLRGHGGWEHFGDAPQEADSKVDMAGTSVDPEN